jgi:hypothetical protein
MESDMSIETQRARARVIPEGINLAEVTLPPVAQGNSSSSPSLPGNKIIGRQSEEFAARVTTDNCLDSVHELVAGRIAALHFKGVVSTQWCDEVTERFKNHRDVHREGVEPPIFTVGKHLYACGEGATIECYFKDLPKFNKIMDELLPKQEDPLIDFLARMAKENGMDFELLKADGCCVEHGTLRLWGNASTNSKNTSQIHGCRHAGGDLVWFALPHEDLKETNASHPMLTQIQGTDNIYGVILCLQAVQGREPRTILWNKELSLEQIKDPLNKSTHGSYGFSEQLLQDAEVTAIKLEPGDIGIIPAHKVHAVVGHKDATRCSLSGFVHFIKDADGKPIKIVFRT